MHHRVRLALATPLTNLRDLLERYDAPADEAEYVAATSRLLEAGPDALSADHYVPGHVTASGFVLGRTGTRLLLIHHRNLGTWLQPGGHIDPGELALNAAVREVQEETGVVGTPVGNGIFDIDVHAIPPSRGRPAHSHYDIRFLLEATSEELIESDEVLGVRWVELTEIDDSVTDLSVIRAVAKLRRAT